MRRIVLLILAVVGIAHTAYLYANEPKGADIEFVEKIVERLHRMMTSNTCDYRFAIVAMCRWLSPRCAPVVRVQPSSTIGSLFSLVRVVCLISR